MKKIITTITLCVLSVTRADAEVKFQIAPMLGYAHFADGKLDPEFHNGPAFGLFGIRKSGRHSLTGGVYKGSFKKAAAAVLYGYDVGSLGPVTVTPQIGVGLYPGFGDRFDTQLGSSDLVLIGGVTFTVNHLWVQASFTGRGPQFASGLVFDVPK